MVQMEMFIPVLVVMGKRIITGFQWVVVKVKGMRSEMS